MTKDKHGKELKKNDTVTLTCAVMEDDGVTVLLKTAKGTLLRLPSNIVEKQGE